MHDVGQGMAERLQGQARPILQSVMEVEQHAAWEASPCLGLNVPMFLPGSVQYRRPSSPTVQAEGEPVGLAAPGSLLKLPEVRALHASMQAGCASGSKEAATSVG